MSTNESTAVATRQPTAVSPAREQARLNYQLAEQIARSTMIPAAFQGKPENVLIALEYARRLKCSELAVMQNLDVIHGRPSLRATFLIGTVNASGRFSPIRYRFEGTPGSDDWGCRAVAKDRESGEECVGPLITIGLAKKEGWYNKGGSKWQSIPELMMTYRAGAWWTRIYCPELSLGLITSDEAEDMGPSRFTPQQHAERVAAALAVNAEPERDAPTSYFETVTDEPPTEPALLEFESVVKATTLSGGDASQRQRNELSALAGLIYGDGTDGYMAVKMFADAAELGKEQAIALLNAGRAVMAARESAGAA